MTATNSVLPTTTTHLHRLESDLLVQATTGRKTFVSQRRKFTGSFDTSFIRNRTGVAARSQPSILSDLYDITSKGNFRDFLHSFDIETLLLFWRSQHQILAWIENHMDYVYKAHLGSGVFFPFIVEDMFYFAYIDPYAGQLKAKLFDYDYDFCWHHNNGFKLVVPQPRP